MSASPSARCDNGCWTHAAVVQRALAPPARCWLTRAVRLCETSMRARGPPPHLRSWSSVTSVKMWESLQVNHGIGC